MVHTSRNLSNRYIGCQCPNCKRDYTIDQGPSEDYFDYILIFKNPTSKCPLCNHIVKTEGMIPNFVEN